MRVPHQEEAEILIQPYDGAKSKFYWPGRRGRTPKDAHIGRDYTEETFCRNNFEQQLPAHVFVFPIPLDLDLDLVVENTSETHRGPCCTVLKTLLGNREGRLDEIKAARIRNTSFIRASLFLLAFDRLANAVIVDRQG